jgi:hypothetical protein
MASQHFIVLLDQTRWRVVHVSGQHVLAMRVFGSGEDSRMALLYWRQQFPQATISFLANHADEQYHVETLPQVRGSAGRQLLMRKLATWPFAQGMHTVCRLDHVQGLRRESRFLFVALTSPLLADWLKVLQKQSIRIQGLYTQALCLACCLPVTLQKVMHGLCVQYSPQQVRISYLQQQRLFFSRLVLLPSDIFATPEQCVDRIAHEVTQIRMTLIHQHWLQEADALSLIWLGQMPMDITLLKAQLPVGCQWVDISDQDRARHLKGHALPEGLHAMEWAAIQHILKGRPLPNLAPESVLMLDSSMRMKHRLHWAGAVMAGLMVLAGWAGIQATQQAQVQMQQIKRQLAVGQLKSSEPINQAHLPAVRTLTQAVQGLQSSVRLPDRALVIMQHALLGVSHWQVAALEWGLAESAAQDASVWKETLTVTWSQRDQNDQAVIEWQQLLSRLRGLPEVEKIEMLTPSASASNAQRQGNTGQAPGLDQPSMLKLYLRDAQVAAL